MPESNQPAAGQPASDPVTVYVSIGNSDDQLTQRRWAEFAWNVHSELEGRGQLHGEWYSHSDSDFQNACWCIEFPDRQTMNLVRSLLANVGRQFSQKAIAFAIAETEFI